MGFEILSSENALFKRKCCSGCEREFDYVLQQINICNNIFPLCDECRLELVKVLLSMRSEKKYYLVDRERTEATKQIHYWNQNEFGYTTDINKAGIFSQSKAELCCKDDIQGYTEMVEI